MPVLSERRGKYLHYTTCHELVQYKIYIFFCDKRLKIFSFVILRLLSFCQKNNLYDVFIKDLSQLQPLKSLFKLPCLFLTGESGDRTVVLE